tara:strand:- start:79 stop:288 length:210 start_codon:yes stop_codon:yes gene_type:complete
MITNLKIKHKNDDDIVFNCLQDGQYKYHASFTVPSLFGEEEKTFSCMSIVALSNKYIEDKITEHILTIM